MNIAIFIYGRGLQVHHYNLVKGFADRGNDVYVFICDASDAFFSINNFRYKNVRLFLINNKEPFTGRLKKLALLIILKFLRLDLSCISPTKYIVSNKAVKKAKEFAAGTGEMAFAIACEKQGLIWGGRVFEHTGTKLFYYSLELYDDNHYSFKGNESYLEIRRQEIFYHQKCAATIVQDPDRGDYLYSYNNIKNQPSFYLPVSVTGDIPYLMSNFLHEKIRKDNKCKIILYFGRIDDGRRISDIAFSFSKSDSNEFALVLNGFASDEYVNRIKRISDNIFYIPSSEEKFIDSIINDAFIGLVLYDYKSKNEELTVFASEKLAYYLKHKKPIIAFHNEHYENFFKKYKCGVAIKSTDELWEAIEIIKSNYGLFQEEAYRAFTENYCFENRFNLLYDGIESLACS